MVKQKNDIINIINIDFKFNKTFERFQLNQINILKNLEKPLKY